MKVNPASRMVRCCAPLAVALSLSAAAFGQQVSGAAFAPVPPEHWAYKAVQQLEGRGLSTGFPKGTFSGEKAVTRYEFSLAIRHMLRQLEGRSIGAHEAHVELLRITGELGGIQQDGKKSKRIQVALIESASQESGGPTAEIWSRDTEGTVVQVRPSEGKERRLRAGAYQYGLTWAPDGQRLAWLEFDKRRTRIWTSDLKASPRKALERETHLRGTLAWETTGLTVQFGTAEALPVPVAAPERPKATAPERPKAPVPEPPKDQGSE